MKNIVRRMTDEEIKMYNTKVYISDLYGKLVAFTYSRVRDFNIHNDNFDKLELRHGDDDWSKPYEVAEKILVNFYGTIMTSKNIIPLPYTLGTGYKYNDIDPDNDQYIEYDYLKSNLFEYLHNLSYIVSRLNYDNSLDENWQDFQYDKEGNRL